jgi:hypothetical protein
MALTSITNISNQVVPILLNDIALANADAGSDFSATKSEQLQIPPGSEVNVESDRVDLAQLEQLQRLKLLTFVAY